MAESSNTRIEQMADLLVESVAIVQAANPLLADELDEEATAQVMVVFDLLRRAK